MNIYIIISIIIVIITAITILTIYSTRQPVPPEDQNSKDRMTQLNNVFSSILGDHWPYILLAFAIFFIVLFYGLYVMSKKGYNISVNDGNYKKFFIGLIVFAVIYTITMIALIINAFSSQQNDHKYCVSNYQPYNDNNNNTTMILEIIGMVLVLIAIIYGVIYYIRHRR